MFETDRKLLMRTRHFYQAISLCYLLDGTRKLTEAAAVIGMSQSTAYRAMRGLKYAAKNLPSVIQIHRHTRNRYVYYQVELDMW